MTQKTIETENRYKNFWLIASFLAILLSVSMTRDINRPFCGLHSWAEASSAWVARAHLNYGLDYTKGVCTWAVGNPPTETPTRYWDHPQLSNIMLSFLMQITGTGESTIRLYNTILAVVGFFLFVKLIRKVTDDITALLCGLFFALFPLVQYFGTYGWTMPLAMLSYLNYLIILEKDQNNDSKKVLNYIGLALSIFFNLLFGWAGFFFAMAIGVHYVARCAFRKRFPSYLLLAILVLAPASALLINFTVMAAGYDWKIQKIIDLYKWRSANGEMPEFIWGKWFAIFWDYAVTNFTLPILILSIAYLTIGQLFLFTTHNDKNTKDQPEKFPQFWLFLMPWVFQLLILRGCLWRHQSWETPMVPFLAIATALGILTLKKQLARISDKLSSVVTATLIGIIVIFCIRGGNNYYSIQWQSLTKINMFKTLNQIIPPDKYLLSFEDLIVNQHPSKGGFYRPEYAYYLDREVVPATTIKDVEKYASTGQYPYYLVPNVPQLSPFISELSKHYSLFQYISGDSGEAKNGQFYKAGMTPYLIFDLQKSKPSNN